MKKQKKTAVIGAGAMGKNHARVYSELSNLVAISDVDASIGKPVADLYGVPYYQNYNEMLDKECPDAVSVVVPTQYHMKVTVDCLKKKIPTLVEKPIAGNLVDARKMQMESKKNKTFLMVGHIERFNPVVRKLKSMIDKNQFGKIVSIVAVRVGINPPKSPKSDVVLDLAIHDIDVCNYFLDAMPTSQTIVKHKIFEQNISDSASVLLRYASTTALIQTNWITPVKLRKLYLTGIEGYVELDYISQSLVWYDRIKNSEKKANNFIDFTKSYLGTRKELHIAKKEPLVEEISYFLNNCDTKQWKYLGQVITALEIVIS